MNLFLTLNTTLDSHEQCREQYMFYSCLSFSYLTLHLFLFSVSPFFLHLLSLIQFVILCIFSLVSPFLFSRSGYATFTSTGTMDCKKANSHETSIEMICGGDAFGNPPCGCFGGTKYFYSRL